MKIRILTKGEDKVFETHTGNQVYLEISTKQKKQIYHINPNGTISTIHMAFKLRLYDKLMMINMAFDQEDKARIRSALHTLFDDLTPYMNRDKKYRLKKRFSEFSDIADKNAFIEEAHKINVKLLRIMHDHDMLLIKIDTVIEIDTLDKNTKKEVIEK